MATDVPFDVRVDIILLMSVNPGFGGQTFIPSTLDKLKAARALIDASGRNIRLEVDGGVGPDNIADVAAAGPQRVLNMPSGMFGKVITDSERAASRFKVPDTVLPYCQRTQ